jgi:hypothetical protein
LALWLARLGVNYRIIDKAPEAGSTSRAMVVHARSLEFYGQLAIADATIAAGEKATVGGFHLDRKLIARFSFGDFGEGLSPYPFMLLLPQDVHERLLEDELNKLGVSVERNSELVGLEEKHDRIQAKLKTGHGEESLSVDYLCACDGAHSMVRETLGVDFPGGTYQQVFFVTDAAVGGKVADRNVHFAFTDREMLGVFPLKPGTNWRLIGIVPANVTKDLDDITYDDVADQVRRTAGLAASKVNWFSTYHVHHRVAGAFRKGAGVSPRRCRPHPQSGGRTGHEYRYRRREQSRLETRRSASRARSASSLGELSGRAGRDRVSHCPLNRSDLQFPGQPILVHANGAPLADAVDAGGDAVRQRPPFCLPHDLAARVRVSGKPGQRRFGRERARR